MKYLIPMLLFVFMLSPSASAMEITAPTLPSAAADRMPENTDSFGDSLRELVQKAVLQVRPDLAEAVRTSTRVIAVVMMAALVNVFAGSIKKVTFAAGATAIAVMLLMNVNSMIGLASETIRELSDYGKLLFPVMTTAMAAQGGLSSSAALYLGTAAFDALLGNLISGILLPMVYLFLAVAVANSAMAEDLLKKMRDLIKNGISWCLKTALTIFTTYMSITGVVSGTTDAAALKATKVTISSVVPVVGGILSDASEAVLVSTGIMKNAAGIYGILAVLALFLEPFLRIGIQYLMLKAAAAVCSVFGVREISGLIDDFGAAMGLLLGMTGAVCLLLLISVVCFMKGIG